MVYGRPPLAGGLLAAVLFAFVAQAAAPSAVAEAATPSDRPGQRVEVTPKASAADTNNQAIPAEPQPAPVHPADLPAAFFKSVPASIADLKAMQRHVEALVARVSPAVVAVEVGNGSGSGIVVTADGLVLTAGHVCGAPGRSVQFTFPNGNRAHGKTLGRDYESDTGLMQITDPGPWPHAPMGDLLHARLGDWVLALGHPGGFDLRRSLVVRLGRIIRFAPDTVQTDCTISPGDSGGPLVDMYGRVIGIHSAISISPAENFHVPISDFYDTWDVLAKGTPVAGQESAPRAYVGVSGVKDPDGCRLTEVDDNSPASRAGLKVGDVVLKVNGRAITVSSVFQHWMEEAKPGETLKLEIRRGDEVLSLVVKPTAQSRRQ
jgi:serine protease Do